MSWAHKRYTHCYLYMWNRWNSVNIEMEINGSYININNSSDFQLEPLNWPIGSMFALLYTLHILTNVVARCRGWHLEVGFFFVEGPSGMRSITDLWANAGVTPVNIVCIHFGLYPPTTPLPQNRSHTFPPAVIYKTVKCRHAAGSPFVSWLS